MGEYVLFAGQEIIPEPDALFQMVKAITEKKADMIYTDEDEISADGKHYSEPEFKPDFNLFRLRENNYIGQFWAIRKEILEQAGKFDPEYDGAQDYDMLLRCSEQAENIVHIPKILCHSMKAENLITEEQEKKNLGSRQKGTGGALPQGRGFCNSGTCRQEGMVQKPSDYFRRTDDFCDHSK